MAYFSQEMKADKAPKIKAILKKYGLKGSLSVRNNMTVVLNISEGSIDFIKNFNETCSSNAYYVMRGFTPQENNLSVNLHYYKEHFTGKALEVISELHSVLFDGHWDESDIMTDYFHTAYYVDLNIGKWNKPYAYKG